MCEGEELMFTDDGADHLVGTTGGSACPMEASKAHPALLVDNLAELEALGKRIQDSGFDVFWRERNTLEGFERFHCKDGFGNRVEVLCELRLPADDS